MKHTIKANVKKLSRKIGFTSQYRFVVFESDDWGSIRVPSAHALKVFCEEYGKEHLDHYQLLDGLDSYSDAKNLESCLEGFVDNDGNHPVYTMNFATSNPVFPADNLDYVELEPINKTYGRFFPAEKNTVDAVKESIASSRCLYPQLHGREHLNVTAWLSGVKSSKRVFRAYELGMIGVNDGLYHAMDALSSSNSMIDKRDYLENAVFQFEELFGFRPESFIAPCYVISNDEEEILAHLGVKTLQSGWSRNRDRGRGNYLRIPNVMGAQNKYGQVRLIRNCQFEPSKWIHENRPIEECVDAALRDARDAFSVGQPAIFCTHRVNYTSLIDKKNALTSIDALDMLINRLLAEWPDIIFLSSDELGALISERG